MTRFGIQKPRPANQLFNNLFAAGSPEQISRLVAEGISGSWRNAARLLSDAELLKEAGRLSSATFLIATAREEIAKAPLLLDACMLDFSKHKDPLLKICQAFYDHVAKHAYVELLDESFIDSMEKAGRMWDVAVKRWWPAGDVESGEPDMPHATYFSRESTLYLDFGDYEGRWLLPDEASERSRYEWPMNSLARVRHQVESWRKADADGLCSSQVLETVNFVFKKNYIHDNTPTTDLKRLFTAVEKRVVAETDIPSESFWASPLVRWPLYHFVARGW